VNVALRCTGLSKRFGSVRALDGVSFCVPRGRMLTLLGPSGCGKTTALRLIAGFDSPDAGTIEIQGQTVFCAPKNVPPEARHVGMVFQNYALFPHLNVQDNVGFGLPGRRRHRQGRVRELLALVDLQACAKRFPHELSGGQQQRVALARTLATRPQLVLLDEPFSNLDTALRRTVRGEVKSILKQLDTCAILVTHDQEEAFELGDEVAILREGKLEQAGPTYEVYQRPRTPFVARFLGKADFLPARVSQGALETELGLVPAPPRLPAGRHLHVLVRPEFLQVSAESMPRSVPAKVITNQSAGLNSIHCLALDSGRRVHSATLGPVRYPEGMTVYARLNIPQPVLFSEVDEQPYCLFSPEDGPCCREQPTLVQIQA